MGTVFVTCPPEKSRPPCTAMTYASLEVELKASYPAGMREMRCLFQLILRTISDLRQAAGFVYIFLSAFFSPRATLAARVLAAESQLAACKHRIVEKDRPRPRFTRAFRLLWVLLSRTWDQWHQVAHLMQPATVKRWHTTGFRLYWRRKSRGLPGRPPVPKEMRDLIRKLSGENP